MVGGEEDLARLRIAGALLQGRQPTAFQRCPGAGDEVGVAQLRDQRRAGFDVVRVLPGVGGHVQAGHRQQHAGQRRPYPARRQRP
jgi:hypothetical protein